MSDDTWWLEDEDLDSEQRVINNLPNHGSHLITGPPGSGKTNLLLFRAAYISNSGKPNVLLLMFNRSLRDFVARGAYYYKLDATKIQTIQTWGLRFLREHNIPVDDLPGDFLASRREIASRIDSIVKKKPRLAGSIECILVDEVQDCLPEEISLFFLLAVDVCFAGDERQRIYSGDDVFEVLKRKALNLHILTRHYRNGQEICRAADVVGKTAGLSPLLPMCNYPEASNRSKTEFFPCVSQLEEHQAVITKLTQELKAYPGEMIAVAAPRREESNQFLDFLETSPIADRIIQDKNISAADSEQCIYVSTFHDVKGLEFRTVHLIDMQLISRLRDAQKRIAFTAMTRAKTLLSIYYIDRMPSYLQQTEVEFKPMSIRPTPSSLFPGRKKS